MRVQGLWARRASHLMCAFQKKWRAKRAAFLSSTLDRQFSTLLLESGKRDSNPRPQPWQGCALPTELFPQSVMRLGSRHTGSRSDHASQNDRMASVAALFRAKHRRGVPRTLLPRHGGEGNRTPDLLNAIQALSQLSYAPSSQRSSAKLAKGCRQEPPSIAEGIPSVNKLGLAQIS